MITTKTGDQGQTSCGNKRVDKDDVLVEVIGTIDELISVLGIVKTKLLISNDQFLINQIQNDLMKISGELACEIKFKEIEIRVSELEIEIQKIESELPKMTSFEIPGTTEAEAMAHFARVICRRTERRMVSLNKKEKINKELLKYFNRLSDYLFIIARKIKN